MRFHAGLWVLIVLAPLAAGCGKKEQVADKGPVEVAVVTMMPQSVSIKSELPGRTAAYRIAEVRPQVSGIVQKRLFIEGSEVKAGQQLLQIDAATYQAAVSSAQAAVARAEAQLTAARLLAERYATLISANTISKQDNDNAVAARAQAEAEVAAAKAQVESARINLTYTHVLAPISGRIGRALVTEGALVTSGQQAALATIQQLDPIYVDVSQSSTELLRLQRELASGRLQQDGKSGAEVTLILEDGSAYSEKGRLQFSEVSVDPGTGAVLLRAVFPNPRRELLPGMFVRARLAQAMDARALLVPQRGVSRNRRGEATVMIVGPDNKVIERVVKTDRVIDNQWLIEDGLKAGDRVIVDGVQKVHDGVEVRAIPAAEQTAAAAVQSPAGAGVLTQH